MKRREERTSLQERRVIVQWILVGLFFLWVLSALFPPPSSPTLEAQVEDSLLPQHTLRDRNDGLTAASLRSQSIEPADGTPMVKHMTHRDAASNVLPAEAEKPASGTEAYVAASEEQSNFDLGFVTSGTIGDGPIFSWLPSFSLPWWGSQGDGKPPTGMPPSSPQEDSRPLSSAERAGTPHDELPFRCLGSESRVPPLCKCPEVPSPIVVKIPYAVELPCLEGFDKALNSNSQKPLAMEWYTAAMKHWADYRQQQLSLSSDSLSESEKKLKIDWQLALNVSASIVARECIQNRSSEDLDRFRRLEAIWQQREFESEAKIVELHKSLAAVRDEKRTLEIESQEKCSQGRTQVHLKSLCDCDVDVYETRYATLRKECYRNQTALHMESQARDAEWSQRYHDESHRLAEIISDRQANITRLLSQISEAERQLEGAKRLCASSTRILNQSLSEYSNEIRSLEAKNKQLAEGRESLDLRLQQSLATLTKVTNELHTERRENSLERQQRGFALFSFSSIAVFLIGFATAAVFLQPSRLQLASHDPQSSALDQSRSSVVADPPLVETSLEDEALQATDASTATHSPNVTAAGDELIANVSQQQVADIAPVADAHLRFLTHAVLEEHSAAGCLIQALHDDVLKAMTHVMSRAQVAESSLMMFATQLNLHVAATDTSSLGERPSAISTDIIGATMSSQLMPSVANSTNTGHGFSLWDFTASSNSSEGAMRPVRNGPMTIKEIPCDETPIKPSLNVSAIPESTASSGSKYRVALDPLDILPPQSLDCTNAVRRGNLFGDCSAPFDSALWLRVSEMMVVALSREREMHFFHCAESVLHQSQQQIRWKREIKRSVETHDREKRQLEEATNKTVSRLREQLQALKAQADLEESQLQVQHAQLIEKLRQQQQFWENRCIQVEEERDGLARKQLETHRQCSDQKMALEQMLHDLEVAKTETNLSRQRHIDALEDLKRVKGLLEDEIDRRRRMPSSGTQVTPPRQESTQTEPLSSAPFALRQPSLERQDRATSGGSPSITPSVSMEAQHHHHRGRDPVAHRKDEDDTTTTTTTATTVITSSESPTSNDEPTFTVASTEASPDPQRLREMLLQESREKHLLNLELQLARLDRHEAGSREATSSLALGRVVEPLEPQALYSDIYSASPVDLDALPPPRGRGQQSALLTIESLSRDTLNMMHSGISRSIPSRQSVASAGPVGIGETATLPAGKSAPLAHRYATAEAQHFPHHNHHQGVDSNSSAKARQSSSFSKQQKHRYQMRQSPPRALHDDSVLEASPQTTAVYQKLTTALLQRSRTGSRSGTPPVTSSVARYSSRQSSKDSVDGELDRQNKLVEKLLK